MPSTPLADLLTPAQAELVEEERGLLEQLLEVLAGGASEPADAQPLRDAAAGLDRLFLLVVAGEFNAGKSAFINALLGGRYLEEGVTPTTSQIQLLEHGPAAPPVREAGYWRHSVPAAVLSDMHIVDTPGTNAILREHESLTRDFVPRSDLVLFVTSADRPFTATERAFLEAIRAWGKKVVFVVNKLDLLEQEEERRQVLDFVAQGGRGVLGEAPKVLGVSARNALRAMEAEDAAALTAAGWPPVVSWLHETLTAGERLRLKLESPLGVATRVATEAASRATGRLAVLAGDRRVLDDVERALAVYQSDMQEQFDLRLKGVDRQVLELRSRGETFLDERFRLTRIRGLLDGGRLREDFEAEVIGGTPDAIAREVDATVDWIVDREHSQWQAVRDRLNERASEGLREAARHAGGEFGARRQALLANAGRETDLIVNRFDPRTASERLARTVQDAVTSTALVEAGALGLGLALKALLVTALEPTGFLAAGVMAAMGLTIIPYRRRKAAEELRQRTDALRTELHDNLAGVFQRETQVAVDRMGGAVAPYGRFVRAESEALEARQAALTATLRRIDSLRPRIAAATGRPIDPLAG